MTGSAPSAALAFGPYVLIPSRRLLLLRDAPVRLGGRALDLLCVLAAHAGEVVSRDELVARTWPTTVVEETSLRVHVAALRKALGGAEPNRYIANIAGRGYTFVAPVSIVDEPTGPAPRELRPVPPHNLPPRLSRVIGRSEVTRALGAQLAIRRFLSIVGPGGIGKTTVAIAVAQDRLAAYPDGVRFVDLAPLCEASQVPGAVASVLGLGAIANADAAMLGHRLRGRRMLIVLDNCEHVVEACATVAEHVLMAAGGVHLLATSREALGAEGEWVHRLAPLPMPVPSEPLTAGQALAFPAIQLFVERAAACVDGFMLTDANLPFVRQVCQRLDGMPLAIEMAVRRVDSLGICGIAARIDNQFQFLTRGRRTASPRHRSLRGVFDWSHELLESTDRIVLRRLSVIEGCFTLETAVCVAACSQIDAQMVTESLMSLVSKSLVVVEPEGDAACFRFLAAARAYAFEKLAQSGEFEQFAGRWFGQPSPVHFGKR